MHYIYIYQQGHVATLHIKLPHQFAGSGRGKVAFKPDRRMGQAWVAYYFHCHFGLIHCSCERDRTGSVDSTDELVQIFSKLRLTCLETKSHDYGQSMPIGVIATAAIHRLVEFNAAWFGCETKLGRGSFGSGPTHQPTKPLTISRW